MLESHIRWIRLSRARANRLIVLSLNYLSCRDNFIKLILSLFNAMSQHIFLRGRNLLHRFLCWGNGFLLSAKCHRLNCKRDHTSSNLNGLSLIYIQLDCLFSEDESAKLGQVIFKIIAVLSPIIFKYSMASTNWDVAYSHIWLVTSP